MHTPLGSTGSHNGLHDRCIARATTDIARDGFPDLVGARVGCLLQEGVGSHQEARGTETALQGMVFLKRLLQGMQSLTRC